ncbi:hypothetical protein V0288_06350 [Pannus brasiliensis CCIBt3594]|uniref:Methyltransferase type 11 n=1 Tax=Pannus brasiliensis CCIBt3594 TaxID=1427578 RepID=A0AAW9QNI3_9CHRO
MLREEASWLAKNIYCLDEKEVFPLLNIGSSSREFREKEQPWIDAWLFKTAREKGYPVIHTDLKKAIGVDIVGDLNDADFREKLGGLNIKSVLCSNLLEHLIDRETICKNISSIVPVNGYLFLTVPYRFPYHRDPIDTMFRPDVEELRQLFPELEIVHGEIVAGGKLIQVTNIPAILYLTVMIVRLLLPVYQPLRWFDSLRYSLWLFRDISATCIVFQKKDPRVT